MRLPQPTNVSHVRGRFSRSHRYLREQRGIYLSKCWKLCRNLKGLQLQNAVVDIAEKMRDSGLYAMPKGEIRFSVMRWFARQEENTDIIDLSFWERWLSKKRINLSELRVA